MSHFPGDELEGWKHLYLSRGRCDLLPVLIHHNSKHGGLAIGEVFHQEDGRNILYMLSYNVQRDDRRGGS